MAASNGTYNISELVLYIHKTQLAPAHKCRFKQIPLEISEDIPTHNIIHLKKIVGHKKAII